MSEKYATAPFAGAFVLERIVKPESEVTVVAPVIEAEPALIVPTPDKFPVEETVMASLSTKLPPPESPELI